MTRTFTDEDLNAYLDGEADAALTANIDASLETDAALADAEAGDIRAALMAANETMAGRLQDLTHKLLDNVLYTSSNLMRNSFAMSDRWV